MRRTTRFLIEFYQHEKFRIFVFFIGYGILSNGWLISWYNFWWLKKTVGSFNFAFFC